MTKAERIKGAMVGLLVGDALGVPYEFHAASDLPAVIEMIPPGGFSRSHAGVAPGTYSDDGAQALCLLDSLLSRGTLDTKDLGERLLAWRESGLWAVDRHVFDIGIATSQALDRLAHGVSAEAAGSSDESACGNGSLMRILPLALWHRGSDLQLVEDAHRSSLPTHGHPLVQACCAFYCLWVREELEGAYDGWSAALRTLRQIYGAPRFAAHARALEERLLTFFSPQGTGFAVDSIWSSRAVLNASRDFATVARSAVAFGNDTDTTAAIASGIAGLRAGFNEIPTTWLASMRGLDAPLALIMRLLR